MVQPEEDIMIITDDGTIIRTPADDIRQTGRSAIGVRLMRVAGGSRIVDVARAEREPLDVPGEPAGSDEAAYSEEETRDIQDGGDTLEDKADI